MEGPTTLKNAERAMRVFLKSDRKYQKHHASFPRIEELSAQNDEYFNRLPIDSVSQTLLDRLPALERDVLELRTGVRWKPRQKRT